MGKIGVYICNCGETIANSVNFDEVVKAAKTLEGVVVRTHGLMCGQEGQDIIAKDIADKTVDRVVTVACSPKMHSKTFGTVCEKQGLNPHMLHMVNIREQCTWMTPDKGKATEKMIRMMKAGVARSRYLEALQQKEIDINPDVLVIGSGIAGVEAALELTKAGRKVHLVEKEFAFGGMLPKLEHTFPSNECAPCILAPRIKELMDTPSISAYAGAHVKSVVGFGGNFVITIEQKPRYVIPEACISCMMCIEDCPASAPNAFNSNRDTRKAIDFPFPGGAPKAPYLDESICLRFKGQECEKCKKSCDFGAIDYDQKMKVFSVQVGSVIIAIGGEEYDPAKVYPRVMNGKTNVITGLDFERMLSTTGPTKGKILKRDGTEPKSIAIVHCVGSRNEKHLPYCSGVCCKYSLKHSHAIKEKAHNCEVTHIFSDLCIDGQKMQKQVNDLRHEGVQFYRWNMRENGIADLDVRGDKINVSGVGVDGRQSSHDYDMVVLAMGLKPNADLSELVTQFSLSERGGFIVPAHEKINGMATTAEGVFVVGPANSPKDVTASVIEAKAAVGEILATYIPGRKLQLETTVAEVDETLCGSCKSCINLCPYHAPTYDEEKNVVIVNEVLCKGCGTCVAACPSGAMRAKHFTREQIIAEIKGVLS